MSLKPSVSNADHTQGSSDASLVILENTGIISVLIAEQPIRFLKSY